MNEDVPHQSQNTPEARTEDRTPKWRIVRSEDVANAADSGFADAAEKLWKEKQTSLEAFVKLLRDYDQFRSVTICFHQQNRH